MTEQINELTETQATDTLETTPLHVLINQYASKLVAIEQTTASLNQYQAEIDAMIAEQFPFFATLQQQLNDLQTELAESRAMVEQKAVQLDKSALKQYDGAVTVASVDTVIHFDQDEALKYIHQNRVKAERLGLVQVKTLPSYWTKAVKNGHELPDTIIKTEKTQQVRISDTKMKNFTGE